MKPRTKKIATAAIFIAVLAYFGLSAALAPAVREGARGATTPFGRFFLAVPHAVGRVWSVVVGGNSAAAERDALKAELEQMRERIGRADAILAENRNLRQALALAPHMEGCVCAEVVSEGAGDGWWNVVRLSKGWRAGIRVGSAVVAPLPGSIAGVALIGRVQSVSAGSADVLLLSDANSQVSCNVEVGDGSEVRGILRGGGISTPSDRISLLHEAKPFSAEYLDKDVATAPGALVRTSGLGGFFPSGIPIGRVIESGPDDTKLFRRASVAPLLDFNSLGVVFVLPPDNEAATTGEEEGK